MRTQDYIRAGRRIKMVLDNQEYIDGLGLVCPNCYRTEQVESGRLETDDGIAWGDVWCNTCKAMWVDEYKLTGYTSLEVPENEASK